jgi:hypothetical protein
VRQLIQPIKELAHLKEFKKKKTELAYLIKLKKTTVNGPDINDINTLYKKKIDYYNTHAHSHAQRSRKTRTSRLGGAN